MVIEVVWLGTYKLVGEDIEPLKYPWNDMYILDKILSMKGKLKMSIDYLMRKLNKFGRLFKFLLWELNKVN